MPLLDQSLRASPQPVKVNMVLNVHRNIRLISDGEKGEQEVWRWGEREIIYLSLHCHHQNDSCIKMGSDVSHFNVSVGSERQSHKTVSTNHNLFLRRKESRSGIEPRSFRLPAYRLTARPNQLSNTVVSKHGA